MERLFRSIHWKYLLPAAAIMLLGAGGCLLSWRMGDGFCFEDPKWSADTWISFAQAAVALFSLAIICWGGYVAVKQLKISAQAAKFAAFCTMNEILNSDPARECRKRIYSLFDDKACELAVPFDKWTEQNRKDVHDALTEIDRVGLMVKYGFLEYEFIEGWDCALYKVMRIAEPLRREEEAKYSFEDPEHPGKRDSHYYLGVRELKRLRRHRKLFDFESKDE